MVLPQMEPGCIGQKLETVEVAGARLNRAIYPARLVTPEHVHPLPNLCVTLRGAFEEHWGRRSEAFDPRTVLIKPPGVEHVNRFGPTDALCINLEFSLGSWEEFGGSILRRPARLADPALQHLGRELNHELTRPTAVPASPPKD